MPYIKQSVRKEFDEIRKSGNRPKMTVPGELNYEITLKCKQYIEQHGLSYTAINDVIGALEGAKLEFYRRVAAPYENVKLAENEDVYD